MLVKNNRSGKKLTHIRLILTSRKIYLLEKICKDIIDYNHKKNLKIKGPIKIPTKILKISPRKSPCGEGTSTWDHFEMRIHKRVIDMISYFDITTQINAINIIPGIDIEISIINN